MKLPSLFLPLLSLTAFLLFPLPARAQVLSCDCLTNIQGGGAITCQYAISISGEGDECFADNVAEFRLGGVVSLDFSDASVPPIVPGVCEPFLTDELED